jgi:hypothetical protein
MMVRRGRNGSDHYGLATGDRTPEEYYGHGPPEKDLTACSWLYTHTSPVVPDPQQANCFPFFFGKLQANCFRLPVHEPVDLILIGRHRSMIWAWHRQHG